MECRLVCTVLATSVCVRGGGMFCVCVCVCVFVCVCVWCLFDLNLCIRRIHMKKSFSNQP